MVVAAHVYSNLGLFDRKVAEENLRPNVAKISSAFSHDLVDIMKDSWASDPTDRPRFQGNDYF